jgi:hypothetical protein
MNDRIPEIAMCTPARLARSFLRVRFDELFNTDSSLPNSAAKGAQGE